MGFTITLLCAIGLIIVFAAREVRTFFLQRGEYGLRRLTLRLSMAGLLLFQLTGILVGVRVFHLADPNGFPRHWLFFWCCIALLSGAILCLLIADLRLLRDESHRQVNQVWRDIAEILATHHKQSPDEHDR